MLYYLKLEFRNVNIEHIALSKTQNCSTYTKYAAWTYIQKGPNFRSRQASSMVIAFSFVLLLNHKPTLISGASTRRRPRLDGQIVGGHAVSIEDFPYQVKMWRLLRWIIYWNIKSSFRAMVSPMSGFLENIILWNQDTSLNPKTNLEGQNLFFCYLTSIHVQREWP